MKGELLEIWREKEKRRGSWIREGVDMISVYGNVIMEFLILYY